MRNYLLKRILFSLFSLLVVVATVMLLVYSLIDRSVIFQTDDTWNKRNLNERTIYEYMQYQRYGYLTYQDYTEFVRAKYTELYGDSYNTQAQFKEDIAAIQKENTYLENATVQEFIAEYAAKGYNVQYLQPVRFKSGKVKPGGTGYLIASHEKSVVLRLLDYLKGFFKFENTRNVKDENLTDRYVRFEKDPYSGLFAIVGSGTQHKYQLYFDGRFPFIHQNWFGVNLGTSYTTYRGQEITSVISKPSGDMIVSRTQFPALLGTDQYEETAIDFHSLTYNANPSEADAGKFPDNYTAYTFKRAGLSRLENSFVIGLIAVIIAYAVGLPLGILMARRKDTIIDHLGNAFIIFIMAVPALAYIFMFAAAGTKLFHLPYKFANANVKVLAYVLPILSLSVRDIANLMKWMRRYMIDQMNSDYVKFARSEGLSEKEIYNIHISKNAFIYLVHGIPGTILSCLVGAIITERVYSVPGVGNLMTTAIGAHDNGVIVACTVFYTSLSIISLILGDLLLAKYDPRISLTSEGGGGR